MRNPTDQLLRDDTAKILKEVHGILLECNCDLHVRKPRIISFGKIGLIVLAVGLLVLGSCVLAHAYTDKQIVNAIYKAEGGENAKFPYGIRSVRCISTEDCRNVCLRTVKNNRIRHSKDVRRKTEAYLVYLSRVYAPIKASNDPKGLNRNWLRNVTYFLNNQEVA